MDRHNVAQALKRFYKRIDVEPKGFHTYRRTYATERCSEGMDPKMLMKIMGHSNINTTLQYYIAITDEDLQNELQRIKRLKLEKEHKKDNF